MNAHVPRSLQTKAELIVLTSVPTQIVSPQASKPVMGLVQDSLLGCYRFTSSEARARPELFLAWRDAFKFGRETVNEYQKSGTGNFKQMWETYKIGAEGVGLEMYGVWVKLDLKKLDKLVKDLDEKDPQQALVKKLVELQLETPRKLTGKEAPVRDWLEVAYYAGMLDSVWKNIEEVTKTVAVEACRGLVENVKDFENKIYKVKVEYGAQKLNVPTSYVLAPERFDLQETMHMIHSTDLYTGKLPVPDDETGPYWTAQSVASYVMPQLTYKKSRVTMEDGNLTTGSVLDKTTIGVGANSLIHVTWNDFGPETTRHLFDNMAYLATNWLLKGGFSIGFTDINVDPALAKSNRASVETQIRQIQSDYIDRVHQGQYQIESRQSIHEQFEMDINVALNKLRSRIEERTYESVPPWNRIHNTITSGSKGKKINLTQIMAILGQQDMEGGRIPDYFYRRTLPHFYKDAIEPEAKGFVEDSFLIGLTPTGFWAHAQSGRIGVISTSIKTAETGYIQRKLIKIMEDAQACGDATVRNSLNLIIQLFYGDDGFDASHLESNPVKVIVDAPKIVPPKLKESATTAVINAVAYYFTSYAIFSQTFGWQLGDQDSTTGALDDLETLIYPTTYQELIKETIPEIQTILTREYVALKASRDSLREEIYPDTVPDQMYLPVNFQRLITNVMIRVPSMVPVSDLNPVTVVEEVEKLIDKIRKESSHFKIVQEYATRELVAAIRANLASKYLITLQMTQEQFKIIIETVYQRILEAYIAPGEMVGPISAQSIGEPTTQLTLNTFHQTGIGSAANVSRGVPRMKEIMDISKNPKTPSYQIVIRDSQLYSKTDPKIMAKKPDGSDGLEYKNGLERVKNNVNAIMNKLVYTTLRDLSTSVQVVGYDSSLDLKDFSEEEQEIIRIAKNSTTWSLEEEEAQAIDEIARGIKEPARAIKEPARATKEPARAIREPARATKEPARAIREPARATGTEDKEKDTKEPDRATDDEDIEAKTVWIIHFTISERQLLSMEHYGGRLEVVYLNAKITEDAIRAGGPGRKKWDGLQLAYNYSTASDTDHYFQIFVLNMGSRCSDPVECLRFLTKRFEAVQVRGIVGIEQAYCREDKKTIERACGTRIPPSVDEYSDWRVLGDYALIVDTNNETIPHSMYQLFNMDEIDYRKVYSNNIQEIMDILGIEAAREVITQEVNEVLEFAGTHISLRHIELLADVMTVQGYLVPVSRYGVNKSDNGPWSRASFEETASQISTASLFSEEDPMTGVTPNIMFGQFIKAGTNSSQILVDEAILETVEPPVQKEVPVALASKPKVGLVRLVDDYCTRIENFYFRFVL